MRMFILILAVLTAVPMASFGQSQAQFRNIDPLNVAVIPSNAEAVKLLLYRNEASGHRRVLAGEYHQSVVQNLLPLLFGTITGFEMSGAASWGTNLYEAVLGPGTSYYKIKFNIEPGKSTSAAVKCAVAFHRDFILLSYCTAGIVGIGFDQESGAVANDIAVVHPV